MKSVSFSVNSPIKTTSKLTNAPGMVRPSYGDYISNYISSAIANSIEQGLELVVFDTVNVTVDISTIVDILRKFFEYMNNVDKNKVSFDNFYASVNPEPFLNKLAVETRIESYYLYHGVLTLFTKMHTDNKIAPSTNFMNDLYVLFTGANSVVQKFAPEIFKLVNSKEDISKSYFHHIYSLLAITMNGKESVTKSKGKSSAFVVPISIPQHIVRNVLGQTQVNRVIYNVVKFPTYEAHTLSKYGKDLYIRVLFSSGTDISRAIRSLTLNLESSDYDFRLKLTLFTSQALEAGNFEEIYLDASKGGIVKYGRFRFESNEKPGIRFFSSQITDTEMVLSEMKKFINFHPIDVNYPLSRVETSTFQSSGLIKELSANPVANILTGIIKILVRKESHDVRKSNRLNKVSTDMHKVFSLNKDRNLINLHNILYKFFISFSPMTSSKKIEYSLKLSDQDKDFLLSMIALFDGTRLGKILSLDKSQDHSATFNSIQTVVAIMNLYFYSKNMKSEYLTCRAMQIYIIYRKTVLLKGSDKFIAINTIKRHAEFKTAKTFINIAKILYRKHNNITRFKIGNNDIFEAFEEKFLTAPIKNTSEFNLYTNPLPEGFKVGSFSHSKSILTAEITKDMTKDLEAAIRLKIPENGNFPNYVSLLASDINFATIVLKKLRSSGVELMYSITREISSYFTNSVKGNLISIGREESIPDLNVTGPRMINEASQLIKFSNDIIYTLNNFNSLTFDSIVRSIRKVKLPKNVEKLLKNIIHIRHNLVMRNSQTRVAVRSFIHSYKTSVSKYNAISSDVIDQLFGNAGTGGVSSYTGNSANLKIFVKIASNFLSSAVKIYKAFSQNFSIINMINTFQSDLNEKVFGVTTPLKVMFKYLNISTNFILRPYYSGSNTQLIIESYLAPMSFKLTKPISNPRRLVDYKHLPRDVKADYKKSTSSIFGNKSQTRSFKDVAVGILVEEENKLIVEAPTQTNMSTWGDDDSDDDWGTSDLDDDL